MNIYNFINSRDIAKHLKDIDYQFSTLECAWLVWQSRKHTLEQKHTAWQKIIDTMPDCSVSARPNHREVESLHEYLKDHMDFQEQSIKRFFDLEPQMFYNGRAHTSNGDTWDPATHLSVESSIDHYRTDYENAWDYLNAQIIGFEIDKFRIGNSQEDMTLSIDEQNQVLDIKTKDTSCLFESLWFDFPTPFEKGDILIQAKHGYNWLYPRGLCTQFVIDSICTKHKDSICNLKKNGTYKDMLAYGYRHYTGYDKMYSYMDLEYADLSSHEFNKELLPISLFLKGEINVMEMAEAYRALTNERDYHYYRSAILTEELKSIFGIEQ